MILLNRSILFSQIDGVDRWVFDNFGWRAFCDLAPIMKDDDTVAYAHDGVHHMFDHEDGDAALAQLFDQLHGLDQFLLRQARHDLIQ
jgi:hypothetical protein